MASAIKRGYAIKDFDTFFPGHGGLMDRWAVAVAVEKKHRVLCVFYATRQRCLN